MYLNIPSGRSGPAVQLGIRNQFGAEEGTPSFGLFSGNIGGPIVQDTSFVQSRRNHGEGGFGSALFCGDRLLACRFGHPNAQPS